MFVFFRLMNFLDVVSSVGPLQLAVKRMLSDVAKLMVLLVIILLGEWKPRELELNNYELIHNY